MNRGVFLTFDVECSMGGAWGNPNLRPVPPARAMWGEYGHEKLGIPLIVAILEQFGVQATFFVDVFTEEQGYAGQTEPVCEFLLDHGQDVQLHIHPNKKHYAMKMRGQEFVFTDNMAELSADAQLSLLQEGRDRLERWTGQRPVAFRAGNMAASETTLKALETAGIRIDSSYTFPYAGGQCYFCSDDLYNGSKWYGSVLEMALSGFAQPHLPGLQRAKPLDLYGISFSECRDAIKAICGAGADAVLILHSFSLFKWRNAQYDGGRRNRIVIRRFRQTCRWLAQHASQYPNWTFRDVAAALSSREYEAKCVAPCVLRNPLRSYLRKSVQVLNHPYWT
ncbi:MAG: polysaccharide deacetylase family protein [Pirellulaceae bacterium]